MMDRERALLSAAGHHVEQFLLEPVAASDGSWRQGVDAVWNRDVTARLAAHLDRSGADVLHVHTPFPLMSPAVFRVAHRHGVATVSTVHSFRYSCVAGTLLRQGRVCEDCVGSRLKTPAVRHGCYHDSRSASLALALSLSVHHVGGTFSRHVDRFLPLTTFSRDLLVRDGIPAERITVRPNCVDDPGEPTPFEQRLPYVLFVGRLVEEKGLRTLLEAWRLARPAGVSLRVAGDGPLRGLVEAAVAEDSSVEFLGWRGRDDVAKLQQEALLTVVPSEWYEAGPPLVLLQALASGTPVLCSDLPNICSSVVEAGAAVTFSTGDSQSLATRLRQMLDGDVDLRSMGARARSAYDAEHTPEAALATLLRVYSEVRR